MGKFEPFRAGDPLGVTVEGEFRPMSGNVKVFGSFSLLMIATVLQGMSGWVWTSRS